MKNIFLTMIALFAVISIAVSQTITLKGSVKNDKGLALPQALVLCKSTNTSFKVDSGGQFVINATLPLQLFITCAGYKDKIVAVDGSDRLAIVLTASNDKTEQGTQTGSGMPANQNTGSIIYGGGGAASIMPVFAPVEATHGSRYLFDGWVKGALISTDGAVYNDPSYGFDYDKMEGAVLLSKDQKSAIQVDNSKIRSFTLYDKQDSPENFILLPAIDPAHYVQVISDGSKYKIYKLTLTHFVKNNYHNDGMTSIGNNYDEYVDDYSYYVVINGGSPQKVALKRKSLKEVFKNDPDKLNRFFDTTNGDIDDSYLQALGDFMNK